MSCCVHNDTGEDTDMPWFNYYYLVHLQMHFIALIVMGEVGERNWGFTDGFTLVIIT